jgi:hypothetical protein
VRGKDWLENSEQNIAKLIFNKDLFAILRLDDKVNICDGVPD